MTREDGLAFLRDLQNANAVIFDDQPDDTGCRPRR